MSDYIPSLPGATLAPEGSVAPPSGSIPMMLNTSYGPRMVYLPAGTSPKDAERMVMERVMPVIHQQEAEKAKTAAVTNAKDSYLGDLGPLAVSLGQGTNDVLEGLKQRLGFGGPEQDANVADQARRFAPLQAAMPITTSVGSTLGKVLPVAAASLALTPAAAVATPAAGIMNAGVQGAIAGAMPYIPPGGSLAQNMTEGMLSSGATQGPFALLQKLAMGPKTMLTPPQQSAVADMQSIPGLNPLPSQLTGNPVLSDFERVLGFFPFSAGKMAARNADNRAAVTAAGIKAISGDTVNSPYGTPDVMAAIKKGATDVKDEVRASNVPIQFGDQHVAALQAIRDQALNANTPDTWLANTIDKLIGRPGSIDPNMMIGGRPLSSFPPEQQAALSAQIGTRTGVGPKFPDGVPPSYFETVTSDLSNKSKDGSFLAARANNVLKDAAEESLPGDLGDRLREANRQYNALKTSVGSFNPATGDLNPRALQQALTADSSQDVAHFGASGNPRIEELADLANAARGMPPPPEANSATARNQMWLRLMGLGTEGALGAGAALGLHEATGGGLSPGALSASALGAMAPFLAANYGTKAYLSPAFAKYAQEGLPTLADLLGKTAGVFNAGAVGVGASPFL